MAQTEKHVPFMDERAMQEYHDEMVKRIPVAIGPIQLNIMITGWTGDAAPYTQTIAAPGVKAGMNNLTVNPINITNDEQRAQYEKAISCLLPVAETGDNTVTLKAHTMPEMDFIMMLKGVSA